VLIYTPTFILNRIRLKLSYCLHIIFLLVFLINSTVRFPEDREEYHPRAKEERH
jgi:hypothetical protein